MLPTILTLAALLSGSLHIRAEYRGPQWHVYLFKPLTTSLIILLALSAPPPATPFYKIAILLGLLFSLGGDIFLMLPSDRFIAGLASFLVAHLWYIGAFSLNTPALLTSWGLLPLLLYGAAMFALLLPHVPGKMKLPVSLYMVVILSMVWRAVEQLAQVGGTAAALALTGAVLFAISDSLLALNRFRQPFRLARLLVLGSYFLAQWLIALSV